MGTEHGRLHAQEIRGFADERLALSGQGTDLTTDQLLELAEDCLPFHESYAPGLYEEMNALASAAGITPAEAVVLGGYTDFIDTVRGHVGRGPTVDECTAVMVPDGAAEGAGYLAQTWDMDTTATPRVVMLEVDPDQGPAFLVFTVVGCLGQIGMNEAGIAVGINNLSADGNPGVTWPFVVRKILQQTSIDSALNWILKADLAGGHNFLLFDRFGTGYNVEAMPAASHVIELGEAAVVHTNHCLAPTTRQLEAVRPQDLQASSEERLADARSLLEEPVSERSLMELMGDEHSICRRPSPPWNYESCGAVIMRPRTGDLWACWGIPADNEFEHFSLRRT